jgi:hypothetical protein
MSFVAVFEDSASLSVTLQKNYQLFQKYRTLIISNFKFIFGSRNAQSTPRCKITISIHRECSIASVHLIKNLFIIQYNNRCLQLNNK